LLSFETTTRQKLFGGRTPPAPAWEFTTLPQVPWLYFRALVWGKGGDGIKGREENGVRKGNRK